MWERGLDWTDSWGSPQCYSYRNWNCQYIDLLLIFTATYVDWFPSHGNACCNVICSDQVTHLFRPWIIELGWSSNEAYKSQMSVLAAPVLLLKFREEAEKYQCHIITETDLWTIDEIVSKMYANLLIEPIWYLKIPWCNILLKLL